MRITVGEQMSPSDDHQRNLNPLSAPSYVTIDLLREARVPPLQKVWTRPEWHTDHQWLSGHNACFVVFPAT